MNEVCTCKSCMGQSWQIAEGYIKCDTCGKEYDISAEDLKASSLVKLTNDNW